jgi:predicted ferric reductase
MPERHRQAGLPAVLRAELLLGSLAGVVTAAVLAGRWLPGLAASLAGPSPNAYWYLARASGIVAYLLLWSSVALGLLITNRLSRLWPGGPAAVDLHQFTSVLAVGAAIFHGAILLGDRYVAFSTMQILLPFAASSYRPSWVGLGQVAFYLSLLLIVSFYFRRFIGYRVWRRAHYGTYVVYLLSTAHALGAGTDASTVGVLALYGGTGLIIYGLTVYRLLTSISPLRPLHALSR